MGYRSLFLFTVAGKNWMMLYHWDEFVKTAMVHWYFPKNSSSINQGSWFPVSSSYKSISNIVLGFLYLSLKTLREFHAIWKEFFTAMSNKVVALEDLLLLLWLLSSSTRTVICFHSHWTQSCSSLSITLFLNKGMAWGRKTPANMGWIAMGTKY